MNKLLPTPLIDVDGISVKLECLNPCGSIKDRIVIYILQKSQELGILKPGMRIVEATSGNTGIAMAYYGRQLGYDVTIVMPEHMTEERKALIRSLGADLVLCSKEGSFAEAAKIRDEMAANDPNIFNPDQFANPLNVECHKNTTAQELIEQAGKKIEAFVAGVGTGGTLVGVGKALLEKWPDTWIAAVEPAEAAVMTGGTNGPHEIFGIGDGFIPALAGDGTGGLNQIIDDVVVIPSADAIAAAKDLNERFNLCVGISSGANYLAARKLQAKFGAVATVFSDGYMKYQSHGLTQCPGCSCPFYDRCTASIIPELRAL